MLALVVYTGKESKIILNQGSYRYKFSSIEIAMNKIFLFQIFQVIMMCIIFCLSYDAWIEKNKDSPQYNISPKNASGVVGFSFLSFFIMLMRLVPLDLIFNTEVSKIVTSRFIECDIDMVKQDEETGEM